MPPARSKRTSRTSTSKPSPLAKKGSRSNKMSPAHRKYRDPALWEGDQYVLEREMSDDPAKPGWRYSKAAELAQRKKWERLMANRPPRKNIPPRLLRSNSKEDPPLMYYGWPFGRNYLIEYAKRHRLSFHPPEALRAKLGCGKEFNFADITDQHYADEKLIMGLRGVARVLSLTKLIKATGVELQVGRPFTFDYPYILVLWSNYNVEKQYEWLEAFNKYDKVVKILHDAMNEEGQTTELRWWWSWDNDVNVLTSLN